MIIITTCVRVEPFDSGSFLDFAPLIDSSWIFYIPPFSPVSFPFRVLQWLLMTVSLCGLSHATCWPGLCYVFIPCNVILRSSVGESWLWNDLTPTLTRRWYYAKLKRIFQSGNKFNLKFQFDWNHNLNPSQSVPISLSAFFLFPSSRKTIKNVRLSQIECWDLMLP